MKRLALLLSLLPLSLFSCHAPAVQAKESAVLNDADKLFQTGKYAEALTQYKAALAHGGDERMHTRALFRAVECETLLYQHEAALDEIRAAKLPGDPALRAIVLLTRVEMLRTLGNWYGFAEETEEGAQGSAKLSRPAADRELEAAIQGLWQERAQLAHVALRDWGDFFVLKDADLERYPSLWDFTVLKLGDELRSKPGKVEPAQFAAEDFARDFAPTRPGLARLGALYEESAHLSSGSLDRRAAAERWRVARVMLGAQANASSKQREAWAQAARELLQKWARSLDSKLGRGDAAAHAATLLVGKKQRAQALKLIESVLPSTPESDVAVQLRQLEQQIREPELTLTTRVVELPAKGSLSLSARNVKTVHLRLYHVSPMDVGDQFFSTAFNAPNQDRVTQQLQKRPLVEWEWQTHDKGDHEWVEAKIDPPVQELGLYLVVASADAGFTIGQRTLRAAYLNVTDLGVARVESGDGVRYYAFDGDKGGAPANDVVFRLLTSTNWNNKSSDEIKAGSDGVAS